MCIASGPYTSGADLRYIPWHKLLGTIISTKPNVVLLVSHAYFCLRLITANVEL
jgi:DNA polymerase alpha subunit B